MTTIRSARFALAGLCLFVLAAQTSIARDLARAVPADTLIFVHRAGSDVIQESLDATAFGRMLTEPEVQEFVGQAFALAETLVRPTLTGEKAPRIYDEARNLLAHLARRPVAVALVDITRKGDDIRPHVALVVDGGEAAREFKSAFESFLRACGAPRSKKAKGMPKSVRFVMNTPAGALYYATYKEYCVAAIGKGALTKVLACLKDDSGSLGRAPGLTGPRKIIGGSDGTRAWTVYVQFEKAFAAARRLSKGGSAEDADETARLLTVAQSVVLGNAATMTWERHYRDGGCWSTTYYAPREGQRVTSLFRGGESVSEEDLALIPRSPTWAFVTKVELASAWKAMRQALKDVDEKADASLAEALGAAAETIGYDIESDLLPLIGRTLIAYETPSTGAVSMLDVIYLIESPDPAALSDRIAGAVEALSGRFGGQRLRISEKTGKDGPIRSLSLTGMPMPVPVAPTWGVADRWLVIGLSPTSVQPLVTSIAEGKMRGDDSLAANTDFKRLRGKIGDLGWRFSYSNVKAEMHGLYPMAHMGLQFAAAYMKGMPVPGLPSLPTLTKHLFDEVATVRAEGDGEISISYGPLPISTSLFSSTGIAAVSMGTAIMLPALSRARELSKRTVCAANLRGIGQGMYIHAQDADGAFPDSFAKLVSEGHVPEKNFTCPSSTCEVGDLTCCYEYIPGQKDSDDPLNVLVYDKEGVHGPESGGNVLFLDGHVNFIKPYEKVEELVEETRKRLAEKDNAKPDRKKPGRKKSGGKIRPPAGS
ncbi:MAG: hypothetical protein DCC65_14430 [Planctomycetota bacterium]|nr:MAG: hypothetical protein DCC65_14430 [Planctomycetota bacterium]